MKCADEVKPEPMHNKEGYKPVGEASAESIEMARAGSQNDTRRFIPRLC